MTFFVAYQKVRKFHGSFDCRIPTISQSYRSSVPCQRQQKSPVKPTQSIRVQETTLGFFLLHYWLPVSNRRHSSLLSSNASKKDQSSVAESEHSVNGDPEKPVLDLFQSDSSSSTSSNINPAAIVAAPHRIPTPLRKRNVFVLAPTLFIGAISISVLILILKTNFGLKYTVSKLLQNLMNSDVARRMCAIFGTMVFVRSGLTPVVRLIREFLKVSTPWEKSTEYYLLKELYSPLEVLLAVAALAGIAETALPTLISVHEVVITGVTHTIVTVLLIAAVAKVVFNMKSRILRETKWKLEIEGKTTEQHRVGAVDKLLTIAIYMVSVILGLQSIGLDVNSVLAIGGVGGLAIGLAGREIFENLFSGLLIMGSRPFDVGDEIRCSGSAVSETIEGMVVDIGWYRTMVRNWEREIYVIPNSLFSRSVVLNITRKGKEWRFFEFIPIRQQDLMKVEAVVADMRRIMKQDARIIQKLHKRAFLNGINQEFVSIYISFYLEAPNRDAFMAARQQLYLAFVDCILRNGAEIYKKKVVVDYQNESGNDEISPTFPIETRNELVATDKIPTKGFKDNFHEATFSHSEITHEVSNMSSIE
eukprot:g8272.t1